MRKTFAALVCLHNVAELVEDRQKLQRVLGSLASAEHWREARVVISREIARRKPGEPAVGKARSAA